MKYSQLFGKTSRTAVADSPFISHQLLTRGGFISESTAGRYFFLPLGWRIHDKIKKIIKAAMDAADAQEMLTPTLHPLELWQETNRTNAAGFELMKVTDRRQAEFALGGTAEEMFVDVVRHFQLSYRDLPFNIYQFSNKFRDEARARGGLLRVREFIMKDAYSFDVDVTAFKKTYELMAKTYTHIFDQLGLKTLMVEADNGYIGGEYCHEFQVEHPQGEGRFFMSESGDYVAHEDVAKFKRYDKNLDEDLLPLQEVEAVRGNTMVDGVNFHHLPLWRQLKDVLMVNEKNEFILAVIRGDYDVNEIKLARVTKSHQLRSATEDEVRALGSEPGFISPVGLAGKVKIVGDLSLRTVHNMYGGTNRKHLDALNINIDRDYQVDIQADIAMAQVGFVTEDGQSTLIEKRGVEVGNIFQLGYHYTNLMKGATFTAADGTAQPFYMGCYGIGLGRTLATIAELYHDDRGLCWPEAIAPFQVHLISLTGGETAAANVYQQLRDQNIEVLWDNREISAGIKFSDADLIGNPWRLVISAKTGDKIGVKKRTQSETELLSFSELMAKLTKKNS